MIYLSETLEATCFPSEDSLFGELFHVSRNTSGGADCTPVARFFAIQPKFVEGFHKHWRLDCFFRVHELSPEPIQAGGELVQALIQAGHFSQPIWLSVHSSRELWGKAYGEVFDLE